MERRSRFLAAARASCAACCAILVSACGGGGDDPPPTPPVAPEVAQARLLAGSGLTANPSLAPVTTAVVDEPGILALQDQQLVQAAGGTVLAGRYNATLQRLAQRAQIARVNVIVSSDMACTAIPFGGGVGGNDVMILDGKFLDLMAEVANGLALRESGRVATPLDAIVDQAAAAQMSFPLFCRASDPIAFPDNVLTPQELDRSVEIFTQLTGGTFYHEFGHVWGRHRLLMLRDQLLAPGGGFFSYTSAIEDNADLTSGILSAKAGHAAEYPKLTYDLLTFSFFARRAPGTVVYANVNSWQVQYQQNSPTYSSLATRKSTIDLGYSAWSRR